MSKQSYDNNVAKVAFPVGSSRIRLPAEVAKAWGAPDQELPFTCEGYFRSPGELLCVPEWRAQENGQHPFAVLDGYSMEDPTIDEPLRSIAIVPNAKALLARYRFISFPAKWAAPARKQLDLQIGANACERLASPSVNTSSHIYMVTWGVVLAIYSEAAFKQLIAEPLATK